MKRAGPGVREKKSRRQSPAASSGSPASAKPAAPVPPLKPRRGLFVALLVIFVAWVVVLLGMYFKTVYPARHQSPVTTGPATN